MKLILDGFEFGRSRNQRLLHLLKLHRNVGIRFRRKLCGAHRIDVAFEKDFGELALIAFRSWALRIGAGDPHADVVDGLPVDDLEARALDDAFGRRHDVLRRKAPFVHEAFRDFLLAAKFKARRRRNAHELHERIEAPFLTFLALEFVVDLLEDRVLPHGLGICLHFRRHLRNGSQRRNAEGEKKCRGRELQTVHGEPPFGDGFAALCLKSGFPGGNLRQSFAIRYQGGFPAIKMRETMG